jgi:hypothetical protein
MATAQATLAIARAEVGYHEGFSGGHWNNQEKYGPEIGLPQANAGAWAWCEIFVRWVLKMAGVAWSGPVTAYTGTTTAQWKAAGRWSEYPAIGAQVMFGAGAGNVHTGIVYNYDDTYIYTYEGNTNTNGSPEGDGVYAKRHTRTDPYVYGYGYPIYDGGIQSADPAWAHQNPGATPTAPAAPPAPSVPQVSLSALTRAFHADSAASSPTGHVSYGPAIYVERALQRRGLLPANRVDGSAGTTTVAAYAAWQRALGYSGKDADGYPGLTSLTRLGHDTGLFSVVG